MSYVTKQQMIDRFGEAELIQLTDRATPATNAIVDAVLDEARADATATIDGYLAGRYATPLASVPVIVERIAADIARYALYDNAAPEQITKRYDDAMRELMRIRRGEIVLDVAAAATTVTTSAPATTSEARKFTRTKMKGY